MIRNLSTSFALYALCFLLIGLYCVLVQTIGGLFFQDKAGGSLLFDDKQQIRGSLLLGQRIESDRYFTARPTQKITTECNVSLYSDILKNNLLQKFKESYNKYDISSITPSASLLDPYITERDALLQAPLIAKARSIEFQHLIKLIKAHTLKKSRPFFETSIVNTTTLNAALDGYRI